MTMSSSLQLPSEDNLASLASVCSEPLLDHPPSSYQQSLRSRSAGPGATRNHEKENKSDNIIYPLEEQANQLEQPSDAWMQDEKEHSSSLTADLSRSHPDLRTIPLILTPLPDTRPCTAASVLNTRRNKVAPAAPAGTFHELRSLSPAPDFWVTGSGTSASQSPSHTSFTTSSSARWRNNRVYPSISATEVTSSDPRAAAGEISGNDSVFVEEATGEAVMSKQLSPRQSLGDGADSLIQNVFSVPKASSSDSDSSHVHVPYIPFHCAQEALTVVVNDMQSMKSRHIEIVEQILNVYNDIEQESKSQYRGFVLRLKEQHSSKVGAYKEVVKALQDELNNMSTHWEGTVKSISHCNRELLEENTVLYQKVKDVLEKTQEEKEKTAVYFTKRLDKEKAKHNKLMIRARETMVQFHHKAKKKLTLLEEDSQTHMSKERATHSQELQTLERELEQSRRQLAELTTNCDVTGASLTANKVAPVMAVVESSPVPVNAKTQHIESSAPEVAPVAATIEREATDRNVRSAQSLELQRPAGEAVPAAHSLIKISSSYLSISDDPGPVLPHDDGEPTDTSVTIAEEDKNDFIEFVHNTTVAKGTQEVGSDVDDFTVNKDTLEPIDREELPADDESLDDEELTVAQMAILAGIEESVVAEPQDNAAVTEEDERAVVEHEEMETGDQPLQDEDEQLAVVTSNRGGASTGNTKPESPAAVQNGDPRLQQEYRKLQKQVAELKKQHQTDLTQLKTLEKEAAHSGYKGTVGSTIEDKRELKKKEKEIKDAQKQCNIAKNNLTKIQSQLTSTETELSSLKKNHDRLSEEMRNKETELAKLSSAAKDGAAAIEKLDELQEVTKKQSEEIQKLVTSFNSERVLRKKYHNMIEDMKGKIRVYCRKDRSVIDSPDEYSVHVRTTRTTKEYQFDQVFTAEHSQEKVFEDTKNLIQSAVDGYNVCLFAYGQTGSGKTYTMIGGKDSKGVLTSPGIAPRAFNEIYRILDANSEKFSFSVACYMLELYNDRLIDLFNPRGKEPAKLDIKKDKKGMVVVQGSISHPTDSSEQLLELFEKGSRNRHVSSTKMNAESSRSHLVIGVIIESTNKTNGSVHRGKLSIVDLAGSERASKTGATAEQLKEAQSINKSLSALGDVISALSSGQEFIPYRNNRLTLLMQDSLGGNAKTLMFVNISPADYNADETVTSLTYAARVKLISNDASKNAENREITRLKGIIAALKKGEELGEDDLEL